MIGDSKWAVCEKEKKNYYHNLSGRNISNTRSNALKYPS